MRALVVALVILFAAGPARAQQAPTAQLSLESRDVHAGVPFTLSMVIDGFEESPQPAIPKLEIPGAKVTSIGAAPQVRESISIINGRQTRERTVRWVLKWSVEFAKAGRVRVGPVTATQGSRRAVAGAGDVEISEVASTADMKFELVLPDRPVFVGETIEVKLVWTFPGQPDNPQFAVPLAQSDDFIVTAMPAAQDQRTFPMSIGGKELPVPFDVDQVAVNGRELNRITMRLLAAPKKAGKITLPGASIVVGLPVGRPDFFGRSATKLFKASDSPKSIEVKPLPETDKPAGFAGAVGTQFSIAVGTSRSVVQLGEPVTLDVTIKSNQRLDTLSLPKLDGPGGLPKDKFTVGADVPTGDLADEGTTKTFKVTAQVTGPATEIPAIAFSYFDPVKGQYQTIHSDPIAVSVKGGSVVGAGDVVAVAPTKKPGVSAQPEADLALVGAELALSSPAAATKQPLAGMLLWLLVGLLYALPLAVLAFRTWQLRTQGQREEAAEVRAARKKAETELARAAKDPARETAGALVSALRSFARTVDRDPNDDGGLFAKIETESFAPGASESPLSADLRSRAEDLVRRWSGEAERKRNAKPVAAASMVLVLAFAPKADAGPLETGRAAYQEAMATTDATARKAAFARAATALGEAALAMPDRPELLADWGNAALGAGDVGSATLAYRRSLALDAGNARAQRNLAWLRSRQSDQLRPASGDSADALFFFHTWPRSRRLLVGAGAFAIAILLLVPWAGRRRRALTGAALLPAAIWIAMLVSLVIENRHTDDAVVMDSVILRAADSAGAPAAVSSALPRGTEVTLLERRDSWAKIRLANGTAGWVPDGAVARIHTP
jgi:hypothetical protein